MKPAIFIILTFLIEVSSAQGTKSFETYFSNETLRIDFFHGGDAKTEYFSPDRIYVQGPWAGNPDRCIQDFELGSYKVEVIDIATNKVIYSKGYSTIFSEYQTTGPAIKGVFKTYHETVLIPKPHRTVLLIIKKRDRYNILNQVYRLNIDPSDYHMNNENTAGVADQKIAIVKSGDPHHCVDLVFLGEGYKQNEIEKFRSDLSYYTTLFFTLEPYKSRKGLFNITGVFSPSPESGTDEPRQGIYKKTRFSSSFNTFDLDRYCTVDDNRNIRDVAAQVPYDAILIMVNRERYGGGGIYNWQTVFNTTVKANDYVFLHEFGHAFAGLGDEYFSSEVAYEDFYTPGVEPLEANITTLPDPSDVKWKQFLSPGIQVPTEWGKHVYDSLNSKISEIRIEQAATIDQMKKSISSAAEIEQAERSYKERIDRLSKSIEDFFFNHPLRDKIGVFEGANYLSKGMYRPTLMSLMHKFTDYDVSYKPVNENAIIQSIEYYTGQ